MKKAKGVLLSSVWDGMTEEQKRKLIKQVVTFEQKLVDFRFNGYGSLYRAVDLLFEGIRFVNTEYTGFVVRPSVSRDFFEDGRKNVESDRDPCKFPSWFPSLPLIR